MTRRSFTSVLITGASSGIGGALARELAASGVRLCLLGRDLARLEAVAAACRVKGATVETHAADVTDCALMQTLIVEADDRHPFDLVVANAGISGGTSGGGEAAEQTRAIFAVNLGGVLNTVLPAIEAMRQRRQGHIALVSSVAGFRGMPGAPSYCASKAAVRVWGEGLRGWLANEGIAVSVVMPGFVESAMTAANDFSMPLLMSAERAARLIRKGLERNRGRIAFPLPTVFAAWLLATLPDAVSSWIGRRLPAK